MPTPVLMPALSPTMEEGTLAKWTVKEGDAISSGDVIAEIETDKATMEVEAVDDGVIGKLVIPEGAENVKVNALIAVLVEEGENADEIDLASLNGASAQTSQTAAAPDQPSSEAGDIAAPAPPHSAASADPELPTDVEMVRTTVRDALRDAMAEEMRRDPDVFLMGEEVAAVSGRLQSEPRPAR